MSTSSNWRYDWLKTVNRTDLLLRAKVVACALVVEFCNKETGRIDPGIRRLVTATGLPLDTLKRALRDLIDGGWLGRSEGRGAGNKTVYTLLSPGKVVAISSTNKPTEAHQSKGGTRAPLEREKGAPVHGKGGTGAPSHNRDKQTIEQRGASLDRFKNYQFPGNATEGLQLVEAKDQHRLNDWAEWLTREGFPKLHALNITRTDEKKGREFFALPYRKPPTDERQASEARAFFTAMASQEIAA